MRLLSPLQPQQEVHQPDPVHRLHQWHPGHPVSHLLLLTLLQLPDLFFQYVYGMQFQAQHPHTAYEVLSVMILHWKESFFHFLLLKLQFHHKSSQLPKSMYLSFSDSSSLPQNSILHFFHLFPARHLEKCLVPYPYIPPGESETDCNV